MRWFVRLLVLTMLACTGASAQTPKRVALVVANANYAGYPPLPNTSVDAALVAEALRRAGFSIVDVKTDQGIAGFRTALGAFQTRAQGAEVAAVYFAGHGMEVNGRNWLIPTDAALENDGQLAFQAIDADLLVQAAAGARTRIVVLDACRENPFAGRMRRTGRVTRDAAPGLALPIGEGARGTLLMYSAAPGELAADGANGQGSPFARAFARYLPLPGVELRVAAGKIADAVYEETRQAQLPYTSSSLSGAELYLVSGARTAAPQDELDRLRRENEVLRRPTPPTTAATVPAPQMTRPALATSVATAGSTFRDCTECPEMVRIQAGQFTRALSASDAGRSNSEGFPRTVSVSSIAVSTTEITFAHWDACVDAGGCNGYRPRDSGWGRGNRPVIFVSWNDSQAYVQWLSQRTGQRYRLLTSDEWEFAARAGTSTKFFWGDQEPVCDERARNGANFEQCQGKPLPVGSFQPNEFGLFDMHGNVYEWVGDAEGTDRVLRGGSWQNDSGYLRSNHRHRYDPDGRIAVIGFRVAKDL